MGEGVHRARGDRVVAIVDRWTSGRRAYLTAGMLFGLCTLAFFNPLLRGDTFGPTAALQNYYWPWAAHPSPYALDTSTFDYFDTTLPWSQFIRSALRDGHLPLWNPGNHGGVAFVANSLGFTLYPPRMLLLVTHLKLSVVHDIFVALHVFLSGLAMFTLMRRFTPRFVPGLFASTAWMFSSNTMVWSQHEFMPVLAVALPLTLAMIHRADERTSWRSAIAGGAALGFGILGTSLQVAGPLAFIAALFALALVIRRLVRGPRTRDAVLTAVGPPATLFGVAFALCAPIVVPTFVLSLDLSRQAPPVSQLQAVSLKDFGHMLWPAKPDAPFELNLVLFKTTYVGVVAGVLALVGLVSRRPGAWLGGAIAVGMVLVCTDTFVAAIPYHLIPGFQFIAPLGRILNFWCFAVALLSGIGLARLMEVTDKRLASRRARPWLVTLPLAALLLGANTALAAGYAREITPSFAPRTPSLEAPRTDLVKSLQGGGTTQLPQRYLPILQLAPNPNEIRQTLDASTNLDFGLDSAVGYDSFVNSRTSQLWRLMTGDVLATPDNRPLHEEPYASTLRWDLLRRTGVTTLMGPPGASAAALLQAHPATQKAPALVDRYDGDEGTIVDLRNPPPRAYVVTGAEVVSGSTASLRRFSDPAFDWRKAVILERADAGRGATPSPPGAGEAAIIHRDGPNAITVYARASEPSWLVLDESYDKGWSATVNGHDTPVLAANHAFRAVRIPAGTSRVHFSYTPPGWLPSMALFGGGVMICVLAALSVILIPPRRPRAQRTASSA